MHLVGSGFAIGLTSLEGLEFDPARPHTFCRICGAVFQGPLDRTAVGVFQEALALGERKAWSHKHAKHHSAREHRSLELSGRFCTPEAAHKLVAYGVLPISDALADEEVAHALFESSPVPLDDAEGA